MEFLGCLSQHVFTYSLFICCASYKNNNITDFFPTAYCKSIHTNISSHSYLSVSLMKGIVLFFELCFSLLQSANWIRNKVHIMKTGTGLEPILLKIWKTRLYESGKSNVFTCYVTEHDTVICCSNISEPEEGCHAPTKSSRVPPKNWGQMYPQLWIPNIKSKRHPFCFSTTKNNNEINKKKKSSSLWMCISCMLSSSVG